MFTIIKICRHGGGVILAGMLAAAVNAKADITNDLVAYYNFEGMTGVVGEIVVDQTGHGHDGICREDQNTLKAPTIVSGPDGLGDALSFDGHFYVQIPNSPDFNLTSNITCAAWVSVDGFNQAWQTIFCRGDWSWRLHRENNTDYACFHMTGLSGGYGADGATTDIAAPKRWLHLTGTYQNGVGAKLYINGSLEAVNTNVSGLINTSWNGPVTIGAWINSGTLSRQWLGQIDEVRLYNRALSAADVSELYGFTLPNLTNYNGRPAVTVPGSLVFNAPTNLQLTATVSDDGNPLPANTNNPDPGDPHKLRWWWTVVSTPTASSGVVWSGNPTNGEAFTYLGSPNPPGTLFTCNPTAAFDAPGLYALNFTATDGARTNTQNLSVWVHLKDDYRQSGYMYLSPLPGSEYTSRRTRFVLVRFQDILPTAITNLSSFIQVTGAVSGKHAGQTKIAQDGRTVIFTMTTDFVANELVTVSLTPGVPVADDGLISPYQYQFVISTHLPGAAAVPAIVSAPAGNLGGSPARPLDITTAAAKGVAGIMPNGVSVPSDFPWIVITTNDNPDPDPIFIDNRGGGGDPFNVIFDNSGNPIWYSKYPDERRDMKVQHNGLLTMMARDGGDHFNVYNTNYQQIAQCWAVNGYGVDEHELQMLGDGTYLLIGCTSQTVDMSRYVVGGNPAADVTEQVIQEFDSAGELIFQWRAWDHFDVRDESQLINLLSSSFDFPHMNAIDIDTDGNILLSSRSTSEITKINRDTGEIIWRLGGAHNQFTFVNDPLNGTRNQHAIRMVTTNDYIMFDNGNLHSPQMSRAVEYKLDLTNMTATLVWQYPNPPTPSIFSFYMGNAQRLTNGNTLIDWAIGGLPKLTEVRPDGTKAFEMNWADHWEAYRTWRCPWNGSATQPYLILEPYPDNITLIFNQFGDTNVAYYKIYGGPTSQSTNLLATSGVTLKRLTGLQNGVTYYFHVTAVNKQGVEGPASNEQSATVNIINPGQNMIGNGDFSQGDSSWVWSVTNGASAGWAIQSGVAHFYITNGTSAQANIQFKQTGKPLIQGKTYVLEFDAWSSQPRYIQAEVAQDAPPNQFYGGGISAYLTPVQAHYRYVFTMTAASDFNASVIFNLGGSTAGVFLDNVSLYYCAPGDINADGHVDLLDLQLLTHDWLKQQIGLSTDLNGNGKVDSGDFGILGENWSRAGP